MASAPLFGPDGDWTRTYLPDGRPPSVDSRIRLPAPAGTLRLLADEGPAVAYGGPLGRRSAAYLRTTGAPLDAADFAAYASMWTEPIEIDYRGVRAVSHPPNSCGIVALQTLRLLERFEPPTLSCYDGHGWADVVWVHLGLEASRLALAERDRWVADPDAMAAGSAEAMLSDERIGALASRLDRTHTMRPSTPTLPAGGGTAYITTADSEGAVVSLLEANYQGRTCRMVPRDRSSRWPIRAARDRLRRSDESARGILGAAGRAVLTTLATGRSHVTPRSGPP
jgi:gamma-glutamyltranspeptidase/glutathione hydrolase